MFPKKLEVNKGYLKITWTSEEQSKIELSKLRKNCPCAICLSETDGSHDFKIRRYNKDQISVKSINNIGKYAISIVWGDNHSTGMYEFNFLRKLANKKYK